MRRLLPLASFLALLAVVLARPAGAQTTTTAAPTTSTTSTTTTTIAPGLQVAGCVVDASATYVNAPYMAVGHCTGAASYLTGGMRLALTNNLKAAGARLCGSFARVPIVVLFEPVLDGSTARMFTYTYSKTDPRILCLSGTAECSAAANLASDTIHFHADCR